jgi:hypothetical protein
MSAAEHHDCPHVATIARLDERWQEIDRKLGLIYAQAQATNGRLRSLERWRLVMLTALATALILQGGQAREVLVVAAKLLAVIL